MKGGVLFVLIKWLVGYHFNSSTHRLTNSMQSNILISKMIYIHKCKRCGHEWASKSEQPTVCPKCKTPYWDKERKNEKSI